MEKFLSILRRISFLCMVIMLIVNIYKTEIHSYFIISVIVYVSILIISYLYYFLLYKKHPNMKYPFISRLWREDICHTRFEHSEKHYQVGSRLGGLWDYRNYKDKTLSEKIKSFFVRIIVYLLIAIVIGAIIYALV